MATIRSFTRASLFIVVFSVPLVANEPTSREALCILDFNRQGNDDSMDWLQRGLADMMITSLSRIGPYQVVQRQQLREILAEHRLSDSAPALQHARLARADLLLVGNFTLEEGKLTIELRLLRVESQAVVALVSSSTAAAQVLEVPSNLCRDLLRAQGLPDDDTALAGLERMFPWTVDAAAAYYEGERAADVGNHTRALAHSLDAARNAKEYVAAHRAVLRAYRALRLNGHAVAYAAEIGTYLEDVGDLQHALEFYHFVAHAQTTIL